MQQSDILLQQCLSTLCTGLNDISDLFIDDAGRCIAECLRIAHLTSEEHLMIRRAVLQRTELLRHTPIADHLASKICRALDVVTGTGRDAIEDDALCSAST